MKLRLVRNLVFVAIIAVMAASCIEEDDDDPYVAPTKAEEMAMLSEYIDTLQNRGLDVDTTDMGIYYVIDSIGEGAYPIDGDTVSVHYTGFFITGDIFDRSSSPFSLILGQNKVITGWEDGLKVFNEGAKGYLIIPSEFAYGTSGYSSIPPNTSLIFNIEMLEIKQGS